MTEQKRTQRSAKPRAQSADRSTRKRDWRSVEGPELSGTDVVIHGRLGEKPTVDYSMSLRDAARVVPALFVVLSGANPMSTIPPPATPAAQGPVDPRSDLGSVVFVPRVGNLSSNPMLSGGDMRSSLFDAIQTPEANSSPAAVAYEMYASTGRYLTQEAADSYLSAADVKALPRAGTSASDYEKLISDYLADGITAPVPPTWVPHPVSSAAQIEYFAAAYRLTDDERFRLEDVALQLSDEFPNLAPNDTTVELLAYLGAELRGSPTISAIGTFDQYYLGTTTQPTPFEPALVESAQRVAELLKPRATAPSPAPVNDIAIEIKVGGVDVAVTPKAGALAAAVLPLVPVKTKKTRKGATRNRSRSRSRR